MPECDYLLNMADNHNLSGKFMGLKDLHVRLKVQARPLFPISHFHFQFHIYIFPSFSFFFLENLHFSGSIWQLLDDQRFLLSGFSGF